MASDLRLERELGKMFESRAVITIPNVAALTGVAQWIEHQPGKRPGGQNLYGLRGEQETIRVATAKC